MDAKIYEKNTEKFFMGKKIRTLIQMQNGLMVIPKGAVCTITRKYGGFNLNSEPCKCCGVQKRITRVSFREVQLIEK